MKKNELFWTALAVFNGLAIIFAVKNPELAVVFCETGIVFEIYLLRQENKSWKFTKVFMMTLVLFSILFVSISFIFFAYDSWGWEKIMAVSKTSLLLII